VSVEKFGLVDANGVLTMVTQNHGDWIKSTDHDARIAELEAGRPCEQCGQPLTRYLRSSPLCIRCSEDKSRVSELEADVETKIEALEIITRYGGIDGDHHKAWVLDQVVRRLTGSMYEEYVREIQDGEDGPNTYGYDVGIAP